jgi:hypothetical protein
MSGAIRTSIDGHARALEAAADGMEEDGIGLHPTQGHVSHLRRMAGSLRADAALGKTPYEYHGVGLYAAADAAPSLPGPVLAMLRAAGVDLPGKLSLAQLDTCLAAIDPGERILIKTELNKRGRLTA